MIRAAFFPLATAGLVALAPAATASAQSMAPSSSVLLAARAAPGDYTITMPPIVAPAPTPARAQEPESSGLAKGFRAAVGIAVGAAVGGWLGYFGAQVANSDWARISSSEKTSLRQGYTAAGIGIGAVTGYFLRPKPRIPNRLPQPLDVPARTGRQLLASSELRRSIATNVLEAVEMGRPEWTKQQRDDEAKRGNASSNAPVESISLVVYVGDEKVGAVETLRDIAIPEVAELRFYDSRDARRRWGVDHKYGAIEVVPSTTAEAVGPATTSPTR